MLGASQVVGLCSGGSHPLIESNKLMLWDSTRREQTAAISTRSAIIRACITDTHLVIIMQNGVNLYQHQPSIEKIASYDTTANPAGLCCLGRTTLAFPGRTAGQLQILHILSRKVSIIPAHTSALRALALSADELIIATASATVCFIHAIREDLAENFQGTLVRVHSTDDCTRLAELRRGVGGATIYSIAISPSGERLALSSDTSTLHIFDIPNPSKYKQLQRRGSPASDGRPGTEQPAGFLGNVQKWGGLAKLPFAPRVFTDVYSFASTRFDPGKEDEKLDIGHVRQKPPTLPQSRKGVLGWLDDETIVVINAGKDARYERFNLTANHEGRLVCVRAGWFRFLSPN